MFQKKLTVFVFALGLFLFSSMGYGETRSFQCYGDESTRITLEYMGVPNYDSKTNSFFVPQDQCDPKFINEKVKAVCFLGQNPYQFMLMIEQNDQAKLFYMDESIPLHCSSDAQHP